MLINANLVDACRLTSTSIIDDLDVSHVVQLNDVNTGF